MASKRKALTNTASDADIISGKVTDVYFVRTLQILEAKGIDRHVRAEFVAKSMPLGQEWAVLAGLDEVQRLIDGLEGVNLKLRGLPEGSVFGPWDPVLEIEGRYLEFCLFETAILGFLCQASGVATRAAACRLAAGEKTLLSFGARRMHPSIAPMIERAAYIGGCDGVSVVASGELLGIEAMGTMPHSLILVVGDCVEATRLFHEVVGQEARLVSLIDTFNDEKIEALRVAQALGAELFAIRLDTPGSRRGDFARLLEEVRWELDLRGYQKVKIYVSGGLDAEDLARLAPLVDGFGIGTALSGAATVDFSMDIVEVQGKPLAKRGKRSGPKDVHRCDGCADTVTTPRGQFPHKPCRCGSHYTLATCTLDVEHPEKLEDIRDRVAVALAKIDKHR